jgi:hypothetical protein
MVFSFGIDTVLAVRCIVHGGIFGDHAVKFHS